MLIIDKRGNVAYDPSGRWLYLGDNINGETAGQFAKFLTETQARALDWSRPVIILINSNGGDSMASLLIHSMLANFLSPVFTVAFKRACSGAFIVFEAGKHRVMMPKAKLKFHRATLRVVKSGTFVIEELDYARERIKRINACLHCVIQSRSHQEARTIKNFFLAGKTLEADEAKKYNLVDMVIPWKEITALPTRAELSKLLGIKI